MPDKSIEVASTRELWEFVLSHGDPVSLANRLGRDRGTVLAGRVA